MVGGVKKENSKKKKKTPWSDSVLWALTFNGAKKNYLNNLQTQY